MVVSADWTHQRTKALLRGPYIKGLRVLEQALATIDFSVDSDYLVGPLGWHVRYEPNGKSLAAGGRPLRLLATQIRSTLLVRRLLS